MERKSRYGSKIHVRPTHVSCYVSILALHSPFQDLNLEDLSMWALQPIPCINGKDLAQHPSEGMVYCWV